MEAAAKLKCRRAAKLINRILARNLMEAKMPPERTTVSLVPRIAAFARTKTFIAVAALIVGVNIGIIIAGYEHRQALEVLRGDIDALKVQIDATKASIKGPSDQQR